MISYKRSVLAVMTAAFIWLTAVFGKNTLPVRT